MAMDMARRVILGASGVGPAVSGRRKATFAAAQGVWRAGPASVQVNGKPTRTAPRVTADSRQDG
jgi:hypothetical protein